MRFTIRDLVWLMVVLAVLAVEEVKVMELKGDFPYKQPPPPSCFSPDTVQ